MIVRSLPNGTTEIDLRDENLPISEKIEIIRSLLNNEIMIVKKRRGSKFMYSRKYPIRMYNFVRDNVDNMKNKELLQSIKSKFDVNITYSQLTAYMVYNQISRKR